ncbi:hypothetical protein [Photobacterium damselae]|uniref:hypothetical protein n=1 Tax=Photobacterium damselae TaxID=38293 RepID=UPI003B6749E1
MIVFNKKLISLAIISSLSLAGCGGGGNDEKQETPTNAGGTIITVRYIDSAVTRLNYQCDQTLQQHRLILMIKNVVILLVQINGTLKP